VATERLCGSAVEIWRRFASCETRCGRPSPLRTRKPPCGSSTAFWLEVPRSPSSSEADRSGGADGSGGSLTPLQRRRRCRCSRQSGMTAGIGSESARERRAAVSSSTARRIARAVSAPTCAPTGSRRPSIASGAERSGRAERARGRGYTKADGAIAQLGERLDRTQEVAGSSPASSIANVLQFGTFSVAPTSRQVVSCYHRATKPIVGNAPLRTNNPASTEDRGFRLPRTPRPLALQPWAVRRVPRPHTRNGHNR
jgi:hypothetical protein